MSELISATIDPSRPRRRNPPPERPPLKHLAIVLAAPIAVALIIRLIVGFVAGSDSGAGLLGAESLREDYKAFKTQYGKVEVNSETHLQQAVVLHARKDPVKALEALAEYRKAIVADPENEAAWLGMAALFPYIRETGELTLAKATGYTSRVSELYPERPGPYRIEAELFEVVEDWENAQESWRKVTDQDRDDRDAWLSLGRVRVADGRIEAAEEAYNEAHRLDPGDGDALAALAFAQQRAGRYPAALATIGRIKSEQGETNSFRLAMARLFDDAGLYERAVEYLDQVLESDAEHREALERRAVLRYQHLDDLAGAAADLQTLLKAHSEDLNDFERRNLDIHLGTVHFMSGGVDDAHALLTKAWGSGKELRALYQLAQVQARRGNGDALAQTLRKSARQEGAPAPILAAYGDVITDPTLLRGVITNFEAAIKASPDYLPAYYALIKLLVDARNFAEAKDQIDALYLRDRIMMNTRPPDRAYFDPVGLEARMDGIRKVLKEFEERDPRGEVVLRLRAMYNFDSRNYRASTRAALEVMGRSSAQLRAYQAASLAWLGRRDGDARAACKEGFTRVNNYRLLHYPCARIDESAGNLDAAVKDYEDMKGQTEFEVLPYHGLARVEHFRMIEMSAAEDPDSKEIAAAHEKAARAAYEQVLQEDPDFLPARRDLLLLSLGEAPSDQRP